MSMTWRAYFKVFQGRWLDLPVLTGKSARDISPHTIIQHFGIALSS